MDIRQYRQVAMQANAVLLDLREIREYAKGHLPGAKNVPYADIVNRRFTPDNEKTYYLYCEQGFQSYRATVFLTQNGFHAVNLIGGYRDYKSAT